MPLECKTKKGVRLYSPLMDDKEKIHPLIEPGSVNKLANLVIPALNAKGFTISTIEDSGSSGEIVSALTIVGSGRNINKSMILPNMRRRFGKILNSGDDFKDQNTDIKTILDISLSKNSDKKNNVVLATLGSFNDEDQVVKIGLKFKNKYRFVFLTKDDFLKTVANIIINESNLPSIQKQFVADQALRLLLRELNIKNSNIIFEPSKEDEIILQKSKIDTIKYLSLFLKKRKINLVESATGGYIAKSLSDTAEGKELLSSGIVLYKSEEKIEAGILQEALAGDNLYGKSTAFALALLAKKRNKNNIAIGVTGLLDTEDTRLSYRFREPGVVYYSIIIPDHEPITEKVHLPIKSRLEMKAGLTIVILQRLLQILIQDEMTTLK